METVHVNACYEKYLLKREFLKYKTHYLELFSV